MFLCFFGQAYEFCVPESLQKGSHPSLGLLADLGRFLKTFLLVSAGQGEIDIFEFCLFAGCDRERWSGRGRNLGDRFLMRLIRNELCKCFFCRLFRRLGCLLGRGIGCRIFFMRNLVGRVTIGMLQLLIFECSRKRFCGFLVLRMLGLDMDHLFQIFGTHNS